MKYRTAYPRKSSIAAVLTLLLLASQAFFLKTEASTVVFSDSFTGTTIDTAKWTESDPGGLGGTVGNVRQNDTLTMTGTGGWGTYGLVSTATYDRTAGDLEFEVDWVCNTSGIPGIGYGDPGVLTGGGVSYTVYASGGTLHLSRQLSNGNAEDKTAGTCTNGTTYHLKLVVDDVTGATLYVNGSDTAAATVTGGTFSNKSFFVQSHTATNVFDNVSISTANAASEPDAPTGLAGTPSSQQILLNWTAPISNGGASITDYLVEYKLTATSTWSTFSDGTSAATSATVTGLTNGQSYDFRVSAVNSVGTGTTSGIAIATPSLSVPTVPRSLAATSGESGQSSLSWAAPLDSGGALVTDYLVEYKQSATSTWSTFNDGVSTALSAVVTGLTNNQAYNFRVSATNSVGTGAASTAATGTPSTAALTDAFTGTAIDTDKWIETDAGGAGGTAGSVTQNGALSIASGSHTWGTQDGVRTVNTYDRTNGNVSMEFSVARTSCGTGVAVAAGYGDFDFTVGGSTAYIFLANTTNWEIYYWVNGTNQSGSPVAVSGITSCTNDVPNTFKIVALQSGGAQVYVNGSDTPSATLSGGTFTNKPFWIGSGTTPGGTSTYDDVVIIEPATGPYAPTGLTPTAGSGQVQLAWTPGSDNGAAITDYIVEYKLSSTSTWSTFADGTSATTAATVTGLTNGLNYSFRVSAVNSNGTGQVSSTAAAQPISSTPTAPVATGVSISGAVSLGEQVTGTYAFSDANGDTETTSLFRWLRADSAGGSYAAIPGATSANYTVVSDDLGKYLKFEVTPIAGATPTTGTAVLSAASAQVAEVDYINQILSTGQSLSVGVAASPALSTTQPYSNIMLSGGGGGIGTGTSFTPLVESSVETISSAMANTITANEAGNDYDVLVSLHGVSGYTYSQLKKGTSPYATGQLQVTRAKAAAESLGRVTRVIGVTTIHGETDNFNGVDGPTYQGYLEEWQSDYENDVKAITGQSGTIPLFLDQMSSFASSYAMTATSAIPIYQLKAAEDNPGKIVVVGPKYQFNYSDRHHLTAASSRWAGEYYGKVIKHVAVDHETWRPLSPDSAERTDNVIYADFHVPEGELAFDTTLVSARDNYGFEYYDTTSSATISSVELYDEDTVKITLSQTPTGQNQRLRYAYTGVPGTDTGAQNDGSAAGNLRDTDPYPSLYGNTLYNWAVHFDEPITVDADAPVISAVEESGIGAVGATIAWITNEPATSQIEYGLTSTYTASSTESGTRATSHSRALSGLAACTTYHYRVRGEDVGNNVRYSSDDTFTTTCTGNAEVATASEAVITTGAGGTVSVSGLGLTVPAAFTATSSSVVFQAKELVAGTFFSSAGVPANRENVGGLVVNLTALTDIGALLHSFDQPLSVTFSYDDADIAGVEESSLAIYRYDGSDWHLLDECVVDTAGNSVTCETTAFSDFGLFGEESEVVDSDSGSSGHGRSSRRSRAVADPADAAPVPSAPAAAVFSRDLELGTIHDEVRLLQQYLNKNGSTIAATGVGSPGLETNFFGALTKAAVARFQQANGILPASGYFGPLTRALVNGSASAEAPAAPNPATVSAGPSVYARDLDVGMTGEDVKALQVYLNSHGHAVAEAGPGSKGSETMMFGYATQAALMRFQQAHGITPAAGYFGPKTRMMLSQ